jgi:hypothetical protein
MVGRSVALLVLGACSFTPGRFGSGGDDAQVGGDDASADDATDDAPLCESWQAHHFAPCAIPPPTDGLTLTMANSPYTYTTTTGELTDKNGAVAVTDTVITQTGGTMAALISVSSMTIETGARLDVVGDKPLIIASWGTIAIDGILDAGSRTTGPRVGAGGGPAELCTGAQLAKPGDDETTTGGGSGGGGGGGFQGAGGGGGPGDSGGENPGGAGGGAVAAFPQIVRGGCSGAVSGKAGPDSSSADPDARSAGGGGGGAVQLTARTGITVNDTARLTAGGAGGGGSPDAAACGGGGGGAGGYVGLVSPLVIFSGAPILAANGGGGGGSALFANPGDPGDDAGASVTSAIGGAASSCSVQGGGGAAGATLLGATAAQTQVTCGGGAGGGGAGFIGIFSPAFTIASAQLSPAHQINPF